MTATTHPQRLTNILLIIIAVLIIVMIILQVWHMIDSQSRGIRMGPTPKLAPTKAAPHLPDEFLRRFKNPEAYAPLSNPPV